ncbi:Cytochrome c-555 [Thalassocella blandensis]|nr:Cytochrome c-555 [Thalassocella blandensis]
MMKLIKIAAVLLAAASIQVLAEKAATADKKDTLEERIKPAGTLCMSGDDCAAAPVQAAASGEPRSGQTVYESKCATCHATGAANAPKYKDAGAWAPRIAKGMDTLYTHAISGFNGMPAKGLCFDCSDDEIKAGVDYMVEHSK